MPPTLKDSFTLPTPTEKPERASETQAAGADASSTQAVALEVPVSVNGVRAVEGSEKREPFSETTSTVLVRANGAVIRLSSSVAPGQLLFLTNNKTRKEVICQVVKSKSHRSASGYVELEFTEPVLGFWGMRFPGERNIAASNSSTRKADSVTASDPALTPVKTPDPQTSSYADAKHSSENVTSNLADAVQEFKTEIKADERPTSKADFLAPAEPSIGGLKLEANRLQEQLSSLLFAEQKEAEGQLADPVAPPSKQDAPAKISDVAKEAPAAKLPAVSKPAISKAEEAATPTAPAATQPAATQPAAKSSFESDEVKIPAWLEPLARNASVHAPPEEKTPGDSDSQAEEWHALEPTDSASAKKTAAGTSVKKQVATPKPASSAAVFGNSLLGGVSPEDPSKPQGSGKQIGLLIAAGFILAAAGGGAWYFRESLGFARPASSSVRSSLTPAPSIVPDSHPAAAINSVDASPIVANTDSASAKTEVSGPVSPAPQSKLQPAAITERVPKTNSSNEVVNARELKTPDKSVEVVEPQIRKPSLGDVRLAKPKVGRSANVQANSDVEPALDLSGGSVSGGENSLAANFGSPSNQPAAPEAPRAAGGDVKPARMISSVPPTYPALAKSQHVSGDVRIDALVDVNGRITSMKVISGPALLHQAAMNALRQWKYEAATLDGKAVPMHLTVTVQFHLQ